MGQADPMPMLTLQAPRELYLTHWRIGRFAGVAALAAVLAGGLPRAGQAQKSGEGFQTAAPHAILIDSDSGSVLFEKAADQLTFPASLSKLMTVEVVFHEIKEGRLDPDAEFMISENAWRRGGAPPGGWAMCAARNSRVKVTDLLYGVIVQ